MKRSLYKIDCGGQTIKPLLKIIEIASHRNGVTGEPFWVVRFDERGNGRMVAILFSGKGQCAVLEVDETANDNIAFAMGNSWRGDDYEPTLRKAIEEWEKARELEYLASKSSEKV
jgi:hypothetical protein